MYNLTLLVCVLYNVLCIRLLVWHALDRGYKRENIPETILFLESTKAGHRKFCFQSTNCKSANFFLRLLNTNEFPIWACP
jgi:hypothetical protein